MNKKVIMSNILISLIASSIVGGLVMLPFYIDWSNYREDFKRMNHIDEEHLNKTTETALSIIDGHFALRDKVIYALSFMVSFCCCMMIYPIKKPLFEG